MQQVPVISLAEAGALIPDGATVTVSSSCGLGCPDAAPRGSASGSTPREPRAACTTTHPIAAGDMYGIQGIDHIAQPGLLKRVIVAGSYPAGRRGRAAEDLADDRRDEVEAYNMPSGVLFHMHRAGAAGQPGVLTKVGLDTFVDPRRHGGRMNAATTDDIVRVVEFDGEEWLFFTAIPPDVAIIRAHHRRRARQHPYGARGRLRSARWTRRSPRTTTAAS